MILIFIFFYFFIKAQASKLTKEEALIISKDHILQNRVLKSFILMLDFWGMKLQIETGKISRSNDYKSRYLNWIGTHNHLRITRTLKSLRKEIKCQKKNFLNFR